MLLRTSCTRDCPDACSVLATVEDGRVVRLQGDPDHPVTRGFLCRRTNRFVAERQDDPDRITRPLLKRRGELLPVSWDDALDHVAETLLRVRDESGPAAIFHYRSGGSLGIMKKVVDHYFELFGPVTVKTGDICSGAGEAAQEADFGESDSNDLFDLLNSRHVLVWGKNAHVSNVHLLPVLRDAKERGARITLIDPVHHRGVSLADEHVQVRPGGDLALALGAALALFDERRVAPTAASHCDGLDAFESLARSRTLDEWAGLADVPAEAVRSIAAALADGPCAILVGWGMQRRANGSATVRALDALCAVSGNLGVAGGGVSFYFKRRGPFDTSFSTGASARAILEPLLGPQVLAADDPPIRVAWITAGNPVAMLPESETVARALESREMTVVVDAFPTDTTALADVVLPTTTMLEDDDIVGSYGHHWIGEVRPVVPPPEGVRTELEIVRELAARTGLDGHFEDDAETWKRKILSKMVADRGGALEDLRAGPVRNPLAPTVLFADGRVPTASGRVQLITDVNPSPPATAPERPLLLMPQATDRAQGSQVPRRLEVGPLVAVVHPDAAPGFADGDRALVESDVGALEVVLSLDDRQRRDVLLVDKGGRLSRGRCANALIRARPTDAGGGAVYLDTPVRLKAVEPEPDDEPSDMEARRCP